VFALPVDIPLIPPDADDVGPNNGGGGGGRTGRRTEVGEAFDVVVVVVVVAVVELDIVFDPSPMAIAVVTLPRCFKVGFDIGELEIGELDKPEAPIPLASLRIEGTGDARASLPDRE
jgi:hypothetical protein